MALSQEEIDALMSDGPDGASKNAQARLEILSRTASGFVRSIKNITPILVSAQKFDASVSDSVANNFVTGLDSIDGEKQFCFFNFSNLSDHNWIVWFSNNIALDISQKMMGQEGAEELNDALMSAMVEAMNNILGAFSMALSEEFGIDGISQGEVKFIEGNTADIIASESGISPGSNIWITRIPIEIDELKGEMGLILSDECLGELVSKHPLGVPDTEETDDTAEEKQVEEPAVEAGESAQDGPVTAGEQAAAVEAPKAVFEELEPRKTTEESRGIDLILDVPLNVTVELGRKHLSVKEILALTPGSLVELEKLAGEAVDLLVNGKLFAKGEVVVIDENFGVRVSSIVTPKERLERMGAD